MWAASIFWLGLLKEGSGVAAAVLRAVEVDASQLELLMTQKIGLGIRGALGTEDFTPRTKRILQIAVMQAARMGFTYVGTEHLLLAILGESDSYAVRFLAEMGVRSSEIVEKMNELMGAETDSSASVPKQGKESKIKSATKPWTNLAAISQNKPEREKLTLLLAARWKLSGWFRSFPEGPKIILA